MRSSTKVIAGAMRILSNDMQADDHGVTNLAMLEAADRLDEMKNLLVDISHFAGLYLSDGLNYRIKKAVEEKHPTGTVTET